MMPELWESNKIIYCSTIWIVDGWIQEMKVLWLEWFYYNEKFILVFD